MMKPVTDKASVSIDFPDKAYMGTFSRDASFDVHANADEVLLKLVRRDEDQRKVAVHRHYYLLADILKEMAAAVTEEATIDDAHRAPLADGAKALSEALQRKGRRRK